MVRRFCKYCNPAAPYVERRGFKVGDAVAFNYRESGSVAATRELGIINKLYYVAGVNEETGRPRGAQDRLGITFVNPPRQRWPDWIYTTSARPARREMLEWVKQQ